MLTDAKVYCMTSMIYLFQPLTAKTIYRKTAEAKLYTIYAVQLSLDVELDIIHIRLNSQKCVISFRKVLVDKKEKTSYEKSKLK